MAKLILMRHGESLWNKKNVFTGWVDVPLSEKGVEEAMEGGKKIRNLPVDIIFTSTLVRAQMTAFLAMLHHESKKTPVMMHPEKGRMHDWGKTYSKQMIEEIIPVYASWHLNERMYGSLQGLNKDDTRAKYGKEQVHIWRRSYDIAPPEGESLKLTAERTVPYFKETIYPYILEGKNVFIPAHGNSLRSIIMYLEQLTGEQVVKLELATGEPIIYHFDEGKWRKQ